jgi:CHAT domain-containing protein
MTRAMRQALTSPEQAAQFEQWLALRSQIAHLSWHPPKGPGYREQIQRLTDQAAALEEKLASSSERFRTLRLPSPDQMIAEVASHLPEGGVLVEYVSYRPYRFAARGKEPRWEDRRYLALLLSRDQQIQMVDLGPAAAIRTAVDRLRVSLTSIKDAAAEGQALYRLVMAPLLPYLGGRTKLLVSPDDRLNLVPFSALHDGQIYLLDRYSFTYLTTGRSLLPQEQPSTKRSLVVLADPDFGARSQVVDPGANRGLRLGLRDLSHLPGTRKEAQDIQRLVSARRRFSSVQVLLGPRATESTLLRLRAPTLLHLATHGLFVEEADMDSQRGANQRLATLVADPRTLPVPDNPLTRSALVLAGAQAAPVEKRTGWPRRWRSRGWTCTGPSWWCCRPATRGGARCGRSRGCTGCGGRS